MIAFRRSVTRGAFKVPFRRGGMGYSSPKNDFRFPGKGPGCSYSGLAAEKEPPKQAPTLGPLLGSSWVPFRPAAGGSGVSDDPAGRGYRVPRRVLPGVQPAGGWGGVSWRVPRRPGVNPYGDLHGTGGGSPPRAPSRRREFLPAWVVNVGGSVGGCRPSLVQFALAYQWLRRHPQNWWSQGESNP